MDEIVEKVTINLHGITSSVDLHKTLKKTLNFPDFYGNNWDAFWDTISGMIELPKVIVFKEWTSFQNILPHDAKLLKELFEKCNTKYPSLKTNIIYL